jgi:glycosyltransferase involved in cell wall biosynthesis
MRCAERTTSRRKENEVNKLSCCILVRDDESTLEACLQSIRPHVDELCVLDTGSSDESPAIAKKYADKWQLYLGCNDSDGRIADFADARNRSFEMATGTHVVWFDADDIVRGGEHMRALCEQSTADYHTWLFQYEYSRDAAGNVTTLQMRERLMKPPHAYTWRSPVHEYGALADDPPLGATIVNQATDLVVVEHRSHLSKKVREPGRNLRILEQYVARVGNGDPRALYYLGIEYASAGRIDQAIRYLREYSNRSEWDDEKCKAMLQIGEFYRNILGDHEHANEWSLKAMTTKSWPEPYFHLGRSYYAMAQRGERPAYNYRRAAKFIMDGLSLPTDVVLFANPQERSFIHAQLNVCFHALGDNDRALWSCDEGLKGCSPEMRAAIEAEPDKFEHHPFAIMLNNRREYLKHGKLAQVKSTVGELQAIGGLTEQQVALIRAVLDGQLRIETEAGRAPKGLPGPAAVPPQTRPQPQETRPDPGKLDLVFFLGPALERWTPETWAKGGMGGSETMAWQLARRLRKMGHRVRFYGDCAPSQEGLYEGVEWLQWQRFRDVRCDVLIASRTPWAVDDVVTVNSGAQTATIGGCRATVSCLWVHDVHAGPELDAHRLQRIDRIFCLSQWHKAFFRDRYAQYPGGPSVIAAEKVIVTRNGIDLARFEGSAASAPLPLVTDGAPAPFRCEVPHEHLGCHVRWGIPETRIIVGGPVAGAADWATLEARGVTHCISVTNPPDVGVPEDRLLQFHVEDDGTPFPADRLEAVCSFARKALVGGGSLYVHCWVGASRSPSFAYAIMRAVYGMTADATRTAIAQHYPFVPEDPEREAKRRNYEKHIEAWLAKRGVERNPHRAVYSSSPDRGLLAAVLAWPKVREQVPDAELHVFYGWENQENTAKLNNDQAQLTQIAHLKQQCEATTGVVLHGRVNQQELAREFMRSGVLFYPTWFSETSMITAQEAQAAGLFIVHTGIAALAETVADRGLLMNERWDYPNPPSDAFVAEAATRTVAAMSDGWTGPSREALIEYARNSFGLDDLATQWDAMLVELTRELRENPMPRFRGAAE